MPSRSEGSTYAAAERDVAEIYRAQFGRLAGWTARLVGDRDLGHDLATEAFVRLLRQGGGVAEPRAWLYATAGNLVKDHWRKQGRERAAFRRFTAGRAVDDHEGALMAASPEPDLATGLTVRTAVLSLPERLRLSVLLHYYADLTVAQVAAQLGKSEGSVKRELWEARATLFVLLEGSRG